MTPQTRPLNIDQRAAHRAAVNEVDTTLQVLAGLSPETKAHMLQGTTGDRLIAALDDYNASLQES